MVISGVGDLAEGAIGLKQRVLSLHDVTIANLMLCLVVTSVGVRYGIGVIVFGVGLKLIEKVFIRLIIIVKVVFERLVNQNQIQRV